MLLYIEQSRSIRDRLVGVVLEVDRCNAAMHMHASIACYVLNSAKATSESQLPTCMVQLAVFFRDGFLRTHRVNTQFHRYIINQLSEAAWRGLYLCVFF